MRPALFAAGFGFVLFVVGLAAYDWRIAVIAAGVIAAAVGVFWEYDV